MPLYFTSTYLPNKVYSTLEDVFKEIPSKNVLLVFDSNIVIYYRDFYLNPKSYSESKDENRKSIYKNLRYLSQSIFEYNLNVNATLGVDESSRNNSNFKINKEKQLQTHNILTELLYLNFKKFDKFIQNKKVEEPIKNVDEFPNSMYDRLDSECFYIDHLIFGYLTSLQIQILLKEIQNGKNKLTAMFELIDFMITLDCFAVIFFNLGLHLFGDKEDKLKFRKILFKNNKNILRKTFNGTIDLILPTLVNHIPNYLHKLSKSQAIPVFVTFDSRISKLHSLMRAKVIIQNNSFNFNYEPELVKIDYSSNLKWTQNELDEIYRRVQLYMIQRVQKERKINSYHLKEIVKNYESKFINLVKN